MTRARSSTGREFQVQRCAGRSCADCYHVNPSYQSRPASRKQSLTGQAAPNPAPTTCVLAMTSCGRLACTRFFANLADYTVRPTRGADNLFLISRASFSAHSPYAHLDGHHQESMHAKVTVLKRSPQTFLAGMHAQLRPIGGRSEPDFSLYNDKECESQLLLVHAHGPDRALGLCTNPGSKESKPASKEKVVFLTRGGRPVGE